MNISGILSLIKKNWIFGLAIIAFAIYHYYKIENLKQIIKITNDSYKNQISIINKVHQKEIQERERLVKKYEEDKISLELKYQEKWNSFRKRFDSEVENIRNKPKKELAIEIQKEFGFEYVSNE